MNLEGKSENSLLFIGFNQDQTCFVCGTQNGFQVFNVDPLKERFKREFEQKGIGHVEMLFRSNLLALVGGGRHPRFPSNKLMLWDDQQGKCIVEIEFQSPVRNVKMRRDKIIVAIKNKVYIYNFSDLKPLFQYDTFNNPDGLCAVSPSESNTVIAFPGLKKGLVHVELIEQKKTTIIPAHDNQLACMAITSDGTKLATASEKGTLIRVFDTASGQNLHELRRGSDRAAIYGLSFSNAAEYIAVTSDKGTIHIFSLESEDGSKPEESAQSSPKLGGESSDKGNRSFLKGILPKNLISERSLAQLSVPNTCSLCVFGPEKNTIIVVCSDGTYYKCTFNPVKGGECIIEKHVKFIPE